MQFNPRYADWWRERALELVARVHHTFNCKKSGAPMPPPQQYFSNIELAEWQAKQHCTCGLTELLGAIKGAKP
jgi:hypothetical protein